MDNELTGLSDTTRAGFARYFQKTAFANEVAEEFGYTYILGNVNLPLVLEVPVWEPDLRERLQSARPFIRAATETARREILIAPIVIDLARFLHVRSTVEYPLNISPELRGILDYLIEGQNHLLIVEAKNDNTDRGFSQLTAQLIALDKWEKSYGERLFGALSLGTLWQFAVLHRTEKQIVQDVNLYRVPADLGDLLRVLIGILTIKS